MNKEENTQKNPMGNKLSTKTSAGLYGKTVYLTFDDGPSDLTRVLLDTLDRYGVKAVFFVCKHEGCEGIYRDILARGHGLGIHSTSHIYKEIYRDFNSWREDVDTIRQFVMDVTGVRPELYRFPGGSYGRSRDYLRGKRDQFEQAVDYIHSLGMEYVDWHVCADDGDSSKSAEDVLRQSLNATDGVFSVKNDNIIMLAHDHADMRESIEAMPGVIGKIIDAGAEIRKLDLNGPKCQAGVHVWLQ